MIYFKIFFCAVDNIPHLQEHICQIPYCFPVEHYSRVFPVSVWVDYVHVFVGEIYSSRECRMTVYNENFSVVAVVHYCAYERNERIESESFYSHGIELFRVSRGDFRKTADVIVNNSYIDAFLCLFNENVKYGIPDFSFSDYEIFEEYEMLCL